MHNKRYEEFAAKREAKRQYEIEHPQPGSYCDDSKECRSSCKVLLIGNPVTNWPLESAKEV